MMIKDSSVFIKGKPFIHLSTGKMAGRTILYKNGFNLFFKSDSYRINLFFLFLCCSFFCYRFLVCILNDTSLYKKEARQYDKQCFHTWCNSNYYKATIS